MAPCRCIRSVLADVVLRSVSTKVGNREGSERIAEPLCRSRVHLSDDGESDHRLVRPMRLPLASSRLDETL